MKQTPAGEASRTDMERPKAGEQKQLAHSLAETLSRVNALEQALEQKQSELNQVYTSSSWRVTAPVRGLTECVRRSRRLPSATIAALIAFTTRHPRFRAFLMAQLDRFPRLREKLRSRLMPSLISDWDREADVFGQGMTADALPPSAQLIHRALQQEFSGGDPA